MTQQIVCDECGEPIDQTQPYYDISGTLVQMTGDPPSLQVAKPAQQMHYHEAHLPASVLDPAPPVAVDPGFGQSTPEPEPEPTPEPEPEQPVDPGYSVPETPADPNYDIPLEGPGGTQPPSQEPPNQGQGGGQGQGQGGDPR